MSRQESDMDRRVFLSILVSCCVGAELLSRPAIAAWRRDNKDECARVDDGLKEIEARRRAGYTAKQGRRLLERRAKLEQKRREKCR
jgi:hypothetical protein